MLFLDIILALTAIKTPKRSSYMNPALNECNILTQIKFVANIMEIISSSIFFFYSLKNDNIPRINFCYVLILHTG